MFQTSSIRKWKRKQVGVDSSLLLLGILQFNDGYLLACLLPWEVFLLEFHYLKFRRLFLLQGFKTVVLNWGDFAPLPPPHPHQ